MGRISGHIAVLCAAALFWPFSSCAQTKCTEYTVKVVKTYPHDRKAYTQGLFFWNGSLYESTGQWGSSSLRKVDLDTGKPLVKKDFNRKYFGEGSCVAGDRLYMLTWTNKAAFVYDANTLEYIKTYHYPREGWGLASIPETADGAVMAASDGSGSLFFLDRDLQTRRTLKVHLDGRPVRLLNELEYIDGRIWANVYTTDMIFIINPDSGAVEGRIDCSNLIPHSARTEDMDVLNGIAVDEKGRIFLTGKNWPLMFQVELVKKK